MVSMSKQEFTRKVMSDQAKRKRENRIAENKKEYDVWGHIKDNHTA